MGIRGLWLIRYNKNHPRLRWFIFSYDRKFKAEVESVRMLSCPVVETYTDEKVRNSFIMVNGTLKIKNGHATIGHAGEADEGEA